MSDQPPRKPKVFGLPERPPRELRPLPTMPGVPLPQPEPRQPSASLAVLPERLQSYLLFQDWARTSDHSLENLIQLADAGELADLLERADAAPIRERVRRLAPQLPAEPPFSPHALQEIFLLWISQPDRSQVMAQALEMLEPEERQLLALESPNRAQRKFILLYQGLLYERLNPG